MNNVKTVLLALLMLASSLFSVAQEAPTIYTKTLVVTTADGIQTKFTLKEKPQLTIQSPYLVVKTNGIKTNFELEQMVSLKYIDVPVVPGDSYEDRHINTTDITTTVKYFMGKRVSEFNFSNADANEDEVLNVADIVKTANIIHAEGSANSQEGSQSRSQNGIKRTPLNDSGQRQYALYNYRNDANFNAWMNIDIDSITYSKTDTLGVEHKDWVVQEVWTPDSTYRIPIQAIDSIGFRAPEPIMRESIFYLRDYHAAKTLSVDHLTLIFDTTISSDSLPSVGQTVLTNLKTFPYEDGFSGKVKIIERNTDYIKVECDYASIDDIFERLVLVGKAVTESESKARAMTRGSDDDYFDHNIKVIKDIGDLNFNVLNGLYSISSIAPTAVIDYTVYVYNGQFLISSDINLIHHTLTKHINVSLSKILSLDNDVQNLVTSMMNSDSFSKWLDYYWLDKKTEEQKKFEKELEEENEKIEIDLLDNFWKNHKKPVFDFPAGWLTISVEAIPFIRLSGDLEVDWETVTTARQFIHFELKGSSLAAAMSLVNPKVALPLATLTGAIKYKHNATYEEDPATSSKFDIKGKASFTAGIAPKFTVSLVHKNILHASFGVKAGLKATYIKDVNLFDYETEEEDWNRYEMLKDTRIKAEMFAKVTGELGVTPMKFLTAGEEWDIWSLDLGSLYLFPQFSAPHFHEYSPLDILWDNTHGTDWGGYSRTSISTVTQKSVMLPGYLGIGLYNAEGKRVYETFSDKLYWLNSKWDNRWLQMELKDLPAGTTYTARPLFRNDLLGTVVANPSSKITIGTDLALNEQDIKMVAGETYTVAIKGGWGLYELLKDSAPMVEAKVEQCEDETYVVKIKATGIGKGTLVVHDIRTNQQKPISIEVINNILCPDSNHPHMIDLGLPSGRKWACCNIGADTPEGYGGYYAWGETSTRDSYFDEDYKYYDVNDHKFLYLTSNISGDSYFDVARADWGKDWHMPSAADIKELVETCGAGKPVTLNHIDGLQFVGPNEKAIFIPAAGDYKWLEKENQGTGTYFWSSVIAPYGDDMVYFFDNGNWQHKCNRAVGLPVRAVTGDIQKPLFEMDVPSGTTVQLKAGETQILNIKSGSGSYDCLSTYPERVTATIVDETVKLEALFEGQSLISIIDLATGEKIQYIADAAKGNPALGVKVEPAEIDFGQVVVGSSKSRKFTVTNIGTDELTYSVSVPGDEFDIPESGQQFSLEPGGQKEFEVLFIPYKINPEARSTVRILSLSENGTQYVDLMGTAVGSLPDNSFETKTFTVDDVSFTMVAVEGGTFMMGSETGDPDESPQHEVTLGNYYIGQTEVTQELWKAVMGSNSSKFTSSDQLPVDALSWDDCQQFVTTLNEKTGLQFRLPTEAEWEYASRGGNKTQGFIFSGSNAIDEVAWYSKNSGKQTHCVASKIPNELGLYDMSGNVWEWCQDWYNTYSPEMQTNPVGPSSGPDRVLRGGGYGSPESNCRSTNRDDDTASSWGYGMRLTLSAGEEVINIDIQERAVDLGLPSGTLWASCNVGASSPEEYGGYYSWGETEEKDEYTWGTYSLCTDGDSKTCVDLGNIVGTQYDVAHVRWGAPWTMPTLEQMDELVKHCSSEWTEVNGVKGRKYTGPNGKSIFLPAGGYKGKKLNSLGSSGEYQTSSLGSSGVYILYFGSKTSDLYHNYYNYSSTRATGRCVRPVISKSQQEEPAETVDLGLPSGTLWASCNLGATTPEETGKFYAWGETKAYGEEYPENKRNYDFSGSYIKTDFYPETYIFGDEDMNQHSQYTGGLTKYFDGDGKTTLDPEDDVAHLLLGGNWHIPTIEEWQELLDNCTIEKTEGGSIVKSNINNASIFLPLTGNRYENEYKNAGYGQYWSSTRLTSSGLDAQYMVKIFQTSSRYKPHIYNGYRFDGLAIRPVMSGKDNVIPDDNPSSIPGSNPGSGDDGDASDQISGDDDGI